MRAKGEDKVKDFEGGVVKQRTKLNVLSRDHRDLVKDVADIERKLKEGLFDETIEMVYVDIGVVSGEVSFRRAELFGSDIGPVPDADED